MLVKKSVLFILLPLILIIPGCATVPISSNSATPAPLDRILYYSDKTPKTTSTIVVTRDVGYMGSACFYALMINGQLAARFGVGEKATFYVEPGEILLRVGRDPQGKGLCGTMQDDWTQRETIMRPGETKYFRLSIDANGKTDIQRSE